MDASLYCLLFVVSEPAHQHKVLAKKSRRRRNSPVVYFVYFANILCFRLVLTSCHWNVTQKQSEACEGSISHQVTLRSDEQHGEAREPRAPGRASLPPSHSPNTADPRRPT
ncbi:hypothetical protein E2C01_088047 [Portunus trituberculatus]|uniref:Uncharacterized protein n=1 Tax=Portunus trituberculatus TaxID=210409 RepID=A0A5B7JKX7_PORTR|nr:hypothetical protein [Portunus trituberculatus]